MELQKQRQMPYRDAFALWLIENFREVGHALAGSFVYLLYGVRVKRMDWKVASSTFVIGAAFAVYASRQVCAAWPGIDKSFAGFFFGLMGMRLTEFVLSYDLKLVADAILNLVKLKK